MGPPEKRKRDETLATGARHQPHRAAPRVPGPQDGQPWWRQLWSGASEGQAASGALTVGHPLSTNEDGEKSPGVQSLRARLRQSLA